jgi:nicotinate-nucleotide adenylyltransferase
MLRLKGGRMGGTGILGGTFNPVHIGHIRHALEVSESLGLDRVLLMPCARPPHKSGKGLLPFALRVEMLFAATRGIPNLGVNTLEGELPEPSYTIRSLEEWKRRNPRDDSPFFLLGAEDFAFLGGWHRGGELPRLAHLVVVPRADSDRQAFHEAVRRFWPDARESGGSGSPSANGRETVLLPPGGRCIFLPVPRLDISASSIRAYWLLNRAIHGLVPENVRLLLQAHGEAVSRIWAEAPD